MCFGDEPGQSSVRVSFLGRPRFSAGRRHDGCVRADMSRMRSAWCLSRWLAPSIWMTMAWRQSTSGRSRSLATRVSFYGRYRRISESAKWKAPQAHRREPIQKGGAPLAESGRRRPARRRMLPRKHALARLSRLEGWSCSSLAAWPKLMECTRPKVKSGQSAEF